ncbi:MAG: FkbM family methyltransferase [Terriglobia bacterium]
MKFLAEEGAKTKSGNGGYTDYGKYAGAKLDAMAAAAIGRFLAVCGLAAERCLRNRCARDGTSYLGIIYNQSAVSIRSGLTWYYRAFGVRGILAAGANCLLGRPREINAYPPGIRNPVRLRVRTTDEVVYRDTLLQPQYAFELPFSPETIVDAGANIGTASIYFTLRYPAAKVIAIEPEASNFALLTRNVQPYPAITAVHAALWNRDGEIAVSEPDPTTGAFGKWGFVTHAGPGVKVRAISMPTLKKEMQLPSVDLLKIDIEGAEKELFEACDWIDGIRCLMIESHDRLKPGCSEAVNRVTQGFSRSQRGEITLYLREL